MLMSVRLLSRRRFLALSGAVAAHSLLGSSRAVAQPSGAADLATTNTRFGLDLYHRLVFEQGNLFLSPFSISTALAMTAAGAKGTTLDEMRKVLHLPENPHAAFGELLARVN